jgi:phosphatidylserine/phosphatidylglycerophosphate/cardiolipin synthase-like enzyme
MQADPIQQLAAATPAVANAVAAGRATYTYKRLPGNPIDKPVTITVPVCCHAGPDAGWPVLREFLAAARRRLSVAIYDFNATYIAKALVTVVEANDIDVKLNWDNSPPLTHEGATIDEVRVALGDKFADVVIPTGAGRRFANSYHEKVVVRDSSAFWLSSGNWTLRSQPDIDPLTTPSSGRGMYGKYNREWHAVVADPALSELFERYIEYDFDQGRIEAELPTPPAARATFPDVFVSLDGLLRAAALPPRPVAPASLPSTGSTKVQPVLTPDNYVGRVTAMLRKAKHSIFMQFAYINYSDAPGDEAFTELLAVLRDKSSEAGIDVRIILDARRAANNVRLLVEHEFDQEVFRQQSNIHNKGIIVDGEVVLVSSANWSSDGILRNRDAGLIIHSKDVAGYYQSIFLDDWDKRTTSVEQPPTAIIAAPGDITPPGMARLSWHEYMDS